MTIQEFNATEWHAGMKVEITSGLSGGFRFKVVSVDFDQQLIGVRDGLDDDVLTWFRCENCKLIEELL